MATGLTEAARQALETRQVAGAPAEAPLDLIRALCYLPDGISVVIRPLSDRTSGMCLRSGSDRLIIANSRKSLGHQRFTVAHEYYHLCYDRITGRACEVGHDDAPAERRANQFAACLLLPEEGIRQLLLRRLRGSDTIGIADVLHIEHYFGVSHSATLLRLRELGYMSIADAEAMRHGVIEAAMVHGYGTQLYEPTDDVQVFSPYASLAKRALDSDLISPGRYEQMMLEAGLADLLYGEGEDAADGDI